MERSSRRHFENATRVGSVLYVERVLRALKWEEPGAVIWTGDISFESGSFQRRLLNSIIAEGYDEFHQR